MTERISRSEQKRQFKKIESLARELTDLSTQPLQKAPISDDLRAEIKLYARTKAGARKRQLKYIAKLLKQENINEIHLYLQQRRGSKLEQDWLHHESERLRDAVVNDALGAYEEYRANEQEWDLAWKSETIEALLKQLPDIDEHELRRSAHHYARIRSKKHYRELFRIIKAATEKQRLIERHSKTSE